MLPERVKLLLAVAVEGDLSLRQRVIVRRWLERSPEARLYLQQLQDDRERVKRLPPAELPVDFSRTVLAAIAERGLVRPAEPTPAPPRRSRSISVSWAVAVGLFLTISLGSFAFFRSQPATDRPAVVNGAGQGGLEKESTPGPAPSTRRVVVELRPAEVEPTNPADPMPEQSAPKPAPTGPLEPPANVLTNPPRPRQPAIEAVPNTLPVPFVPRELDQPAVQQKLLDELRKHEVAHIDLFAPSPVRTCDRLQSIFQGMGLRVLADPVAQERVNRRLLGEFAFAIYLDNVKAEELALVLRRLGDNDRRGDEKAVVGPLQPSDAKEFTGLTGVDLLSSVKPRAPLDVDVRKPVSESTGSQVVQSLGQGGGRPEAPKPPAGSRAALVFAYPPLKAPLITREMGQILNARKPRAADQMGVLLIVR